MNSESNFQLPLRRVCVIGHPVAHSRSPMLHGYWLKTLGIAGSYERQDLTAEALPAFIAAMQEQGFVGCNITVPHKEQMAAFIANQDAAARAIGAVNTIWLEQGTWHGSNTDAYGFMANLDQSVPGWDKTAGRAVVLGAGGSARAVIHGLITRGLAVSILNRTQARAEELAARFGKQVRACSWRESEALLAQADLLVNTTSLGMSGKGSHDFDFSLLPAHAIVSDIVYVPLETQFLTSAKARGLRIVDGLGMLLHQAVPGFEKWFGVRPDVSAGLRALIEADIRAKA